MSRQICAVCLKCLFSLVLLVSIGLSALGQSSSSAAVNGIVQDTTDARIPNASVKLINIDTGTESNSTTSKDGNFSIPSVLPGHYRLQIERDGFDTTQLTGITLNVGDNKNVIIRMQVGSPQQTVTVDASGLTINTTDASVSTVIDRQFVANMPLNGRSFQDLISLTPGVTTQSPQTTGNVGVGSSGDFTVNGQRTEENNYTIDGVSANTGAGYPGPGAATSGSLNASTALGTTQSLVSVDALQEFRVESSTYSAEYGRLPGGQFSLVTRSGTDVFHGSLFDYLRNNVFDANDWFNDYYSVPQPALRQNDFGGTLGGPVVIPRIYNGKGKTFFFFSYEGLRLTQPIEASLQYVPSNSLRASAPAVLQPILNAYPLPTGAELQAACDNVTYNCPNGQPLGTLVPSGLAPFIKAYSLPSQIDAPSLRLDSTIGPHLHAFIRYAYTPSSVDERSSFAYGGLISNLQSFTAGVDEQYSANTSDQVRVGYTRSISKLNLAVNSFGGNDPINLSQAFGTSAYPNAQDTMEILFPMGSSFLGVENPANYNYQWNATDTATWNLGHHIVKAGVDYRRITAPLSTSDPRLAYLFLGPNSIIQNNADYVGIVRSFGAIPVYNQLSLFAQDELRLGPQLTISAGMRWELNPPPTSANNVQPYPLEGNPADPTTYSLGRPGAALYNTTWHNFAPRLGAAWRTHSKPGAQTVVRAGGGIFYDTGTAGTGDIYSSVGTLVDGGGPNVPFSDTPSLNLSPVVAPPYGVVWAVSPQFELPYTIQWNVALEQELGEQQSMTISYVAANGRRLAQEVSIHAGAINPDFTTVILYENGFTSNYQSLQLQLQRRLSHGLQALAAYNWAHAIDYGSSNFTLGYQRGNADYDLRNNFNAGLSWEPSIRVQVPLSRAILTNWGMDARIVVRTAFPVSLSGNTYYDPVTQEEEYSGLNIVPNQAFYIHAASLPGGRAINPQAFASAPQNTQGDAPRNFLRGFGASQANLAVRRDFPIAESLKLQFRAEAFNIFNHPNFGYIDPTLSDPTFGQATKTVASSLPTLNAIYQQGGPRSMQFALKLQF